MIPEWVLFHPRLSAQAVRVYGVLLRFGQTPDRCFPSMGTLAARLGVTTRTVRRALDELEAEKVVRVHARSDGRGGQRSNGFEVFAREVPPAHLADVNSVEGGDSGAVPPGQECQGGGDMNVRGGVTKMSPIARASEREPMNESSSLTLENVHARGEPDLFAQFWAAWPTGRRQGRQNAERAFRKALGRTDLPQILRAVEQHRRVAWDAMIDDGEGQFVPQPATWLNQSRWEEEPMPRRRSAGPGNGRHFVRDDPSPDEDF